jgi:hypothetical protein
MALWANAACDEGDLAESDYRHASDLPPTGDETSNLAAASVVDSPVCNPQERAAAKVDRLFSKARST